MSRAAGWAFNLAALASTLLFLGVCALWVRGHRVCDDIVRQAASYDGREWTARMSRLKTGGGGFWFETRHAVRRTEVEARAAAAAVGPVWQWDQFPEPPYPISAGPGDPIWQRLGFLCSTSGYDLLLVAPYWALATMTLLAPGAWMSLRWKRRRRQRRARDGLCPICGYDLRATRARCPECGHVSSQKDSKV